MTLVSGVRTQWAQMQQWEVKELVWARGLGQDHPRVKDLLEEAGRVWGREEKGREFEKGEGV